MREEATKMIDKQNVNCVDEGKILVARYLSSLGHPEPRNMNLELKIVRGFAHPYKKPNLTDD